jgi:hypothetical protein
MGKSMIREVKPKEIGLLCDLCAEHALDAGLVTHDQLDRKFVKEQIKKGIINPNMQIYVYEEGDQFIGYVAGAGKQKIWNGTVYGEIILFFVHPEARKGKRIADELFMAIQDWFVEVGCVYMQASNMIFNEDYQPDDEWLTKARTYYKQQDMAECGYHFVKDLEMFR